MFADGRVRRKAAARPRDPRRTRETLLQAAFRRVYESGYQGTDLDTILDGAGVTKGALYHHFESKEALGHAIVEEVIAGITRDKWLVPLQESGDPIDILVGIVQSTSLRPEDVRCGCPLNNLAQEMSPLDEGFRRRLARVFGDWQDGIASALRAGRKRGLVRQDVDPAETATYLVALYEGYISLAKNVQDARVLGRGKVRIVRYLESLRAQGGRARTRAGD
jgi:TetR/AcrR family transcriptional regulator, transcriptional repressor for nem operon